MVQITKCDRCGKELAAGAGTVVSIREGAEQIGKDFCDDCFTKTVKPTLLSVI